MCLAVPAKILEIDELNPEEAIADIGAGVKKRISLKLLPQAEVGEYVMLHAGFAISKVDNNEALETLACLEEIANA